MVDLAYKIASAMWLVLLLFLAFIFFTEKDSLLGMGVIVMCPILGVLITGIYVICLILIWLFRKY